MAGMSLSQTTYAAVTPVTFLLGGILSRKTLFVCTVRLIWPKAAKPEGQVQTLETGKSNCELAKATSSLSHKGNLQNAGNINTLSVFLLKCG